MNLNTFVEWFLEMSQFFITRSEILQLYVVYVLDFN